MIDQIKSLMGNQKKKILIIVSLLVILGAIIFGSLCLTNKDTKKNEVKLDDSIVAIVNDEVISLGEYDMFLVQGMTYFTEEAGDDVWKADIDGEEIIEVLKQNVLNALITIKVQVSKAKEMGIELLEEDKKIIAQSEITDPRYMDAMKDQLLIAMLMEEITKGYELDEAEFDEFLLKNGKEKAKMTSEEIEEIKAEIIEKNKEIIYNTVFATWEEEKELIVNEELLKKLKPQVE